MVEPTDGSVEDLLQRQTRQRNRLFVTTLAALLVIFGIIAAISYISPKTSGILLGAVGLILFGAMWIPGLIWNNPRMGFYILFTGSMLFEAIVVSTVACGVPTSSAPFWLNFSTFGQTLLHTNALSPIKFSFAETLMVWTILCWLIRSIVMKELHFRKGAFYGWFMAYIGCVIIGFVNGVAHGGDKTIALWEIRPQFHFLIAYFITTNLVTEKKHVVPLLWIAVFGNGFKAMIGISNFIQLHGDITDQGILGHEESLFFNLIFFIMFIGWMTKMDRRLMRTCQVLLPFVLFADMENQRRASFAAFVIAFVPLLIIIWVSIPERRKLLLKFISIFTVSFLLYLPVAWGSHAVWALPARAIKSQVDPDPRDASSDAYRISETADLRATRDSSPIIGFGYGRKFLQPIPLMDLGTEFLSYMPHNSVLWIWMRLGHLGFFCFLMLLTTICVKGTMIVRDVPDRLLQSVGVMGVLTMLMLFIYGKYDLQLTNYRTLFMTGTFIGVLAVLPELWENEKRQAQEKAQKEALLTETASFEPSTLF